MSTFRGTWSLCGGWAVDAWLGRQTRDHEDLDIAVFQDDQHALFDHLAGWQLVAHDPHVAGDTSEPWNSRPLDLPAHIHGRSPDAHGPLPDRVDAATQQGFGLDIQISRRVGSEWVFRREPRIAMPLGRCIWESAWGVPTLVQEGILYYKARVPRPHDELDFLALLQHLNEEQRSWLSEAISPFSADHPWLSKLSA